MRNTRQRTAEIRRIQNKSNQIQSANLATQREGPAQGFFPVQKRSFSLPLPLVLSNSRRANVKKDIKNMSKGIKETLKGLYTLMFHLCKHCFCWRLIVLSWFLLKLYRPRENSAAIKILDTEISPTITDWGDLLWTLARFRKQHEPSCLRRVAEVSDRVNPLQSIWTVWTVVFL